jgi:hypothetical protein
LQFVKKDKKQGAYIGKNAVFLSNIHENAFFTAILQNSV